MIARVHTSGSPNAVRQSNWLEECSPFRWGRRSNNFKRSETALVTEYGVHGVPWTVALMNRHTNFNCRALWARTDVEVPFHNSCAFTHPSHSDSNKASP